ncbi:MAG: hypothetical protein EXR99_02240 [Gemmataceae bacterium]|nr:hypothetical protein [Gemmataceae bacterium]
MALRCSNPMLFAIPYAGVWIFSCMALAKGIGAWMEKLGPLKNNPLLFISLSMARLLFVLVVFAFLRENVQADILRPMVLIGVGFFIFSSLAGAVLKLNSQSLK